jgi:arylsulfatase A-like enzyme
MTGLHATQSGVLDNGQFLRPDYAACGITPWANLMANAGYYTAAIGKMHFYPWDLRLGFQYRSICEDKRWIHIRDDYYHFLRAHGRRKLHGNEHEGYFENKGAIINQHPYELQWDSFVGAEACRFIDQYGGDGPFFMMVGFPGPHCPYDPAAEWLEGLDINAMPEPIVGPEEDVARLREGNIRGNLGAWNGVDLTEFTVAQRKKVRLHYAAEVRQIDDQVGRILATLRAKGLIENTVIIFSADHGDYLGDHDMAGKGAWYEASCHVPMLVRLPGTSGAAVRDDLVTLTDVTATALAYGGAERPVYLHSLPLPGLGLPGESHREMIFGALQGGWSLYDGRYRLSKYSTGDVHLFDLPNAPREVRNLMREPGHEAIYARLDAELTRRVMEGYQVALNPARVYYHDLSQRTDFGREGWVRPYPRPLSEGYER